VHHSEWGDHRLHDRHWVSVHWCKQAGQTPPVSKMFHSCAQVQNQRSSLRGDQPQSGQRMRGLDGSSPRRFRAPKRLTIWQCHSRESVVTAHIGGVEPWTLRSRLVDYVEWCLGSPTKAFESSRRNNFAHALLSCLSAETQPDFLRPRARCAE
jgi:hypothetical protein